MVLMLEMIGGWMFDKGILEKVEECWRALV